MGKKGDFGSLLKEGGEVKSQELCQADRRAADSLCRLSCGLEGNVRVSAEMNTCFDLW